MKEYFQLTSERHLRYILSEGKIYNTNNIYLSLAIANKELYILEPYPLSQSAPPKKWPLCPKKVGLVETCVHAALAMPATLAALGAIFQAFPARISL